MLQTPRPRLPVQVQANSRKGITILSATTLPAHITRTNFVFPRAYRTIFVTGPTDLRPWHLLDQATFDEQERQLNNTQPDQLLVPFAQREDNDCLACFVAENNDGKRGTIVNVMPGSSGKAQTIKQHKDFHQWLKSALDDMFEWNPSILGD